MGTIIYTNEIGFEEFGDMLWSGARERWDEADDETRQLVWERVEEWVNCMSECGNIPSDVQINDLVWFDCDDLFFPPSFRLEIWRHDYVELIEETEFEGIGAAHKATEYWENWKSKHEGEDEERIIRLVDIQTGENWEL